MKNFLLKILMILLFVPFVVSAQTEIQIGTGTSIFTAPLPGYYGWNRDAYLYSASDIQLGGTINSIAFQISSASSGSTAQIKIYLKLVSDTVLPASTNWNTLKADAQLVYTNMALASAPTGWKTFVFDTPFQYSIAGNLMVLIEGQGCSTSGNCSTSCYYHTKNQSHWMMRKDNSMPDDDLNSTSSNVNDRANIKLNMSFPENYCYPPLNLTALDILPDEARIIWNRYATTSSWVVQYKLATEEVWSDEISVSDTTFLLSNLSASTNYDVRVKSECAVSGNESEWVQSSFTTACPYITIPYEESFDTWGTGQSAYPVCWSKLANSTSTYHYISTLYNYSAPASLYLYGTTIGNHFYSILPPLDPSVAISDLQILFKYYGSTSAAVVVGVMTDKNNATTFVPIDTVRPTAGSTWFEAEIDLDSYTQNGRFIALKTYFTTTYVSLYLDNVTVRLIPSCKRPTNLVVSNILHNSADISFTTYNGESSWEIAYGPAEFDPDGEEAQIVSANSNPFTLTGLDDATYYECYVRSNCGNESSFWSPHSSFTTACLPVYTAPFGSDFSTKFPPQCWNLYKVLASQILDSTRTLDSFTTTSGWIRNITGNGIVEPHAGVNVWGTSCQYWLVTPVIDITELATPYLYFDLALTDYNNDNPIENLNKQADDKFMVAISTDGGASWTTENTILWSNAGGADHVYDRISRGGEMISIPLTHYLDNGSSLRFAFYVESTVSGGDNDLHIGNILIGDEISCGKAQQPKVTALTGNSIEIGWSVHGAAETEWEVAYGRKGFNLASDTAIIETVNNNAYLIENLETNTKYDIYLRTICDDTPTRWTKKLTVLTSQQDYESVPYTCNFEDPTQNAGWQFVRNTSTTAVNNWAIDTAVHFGDEAQGHALYISKDNGVTNNYDMTVASNVWAYRDIYFTEGIEYLLTFKWKCQAEANDYLKVYIGTPDTVANSSEVPIGATLLSTTPLNLQTSWQTAEYVLSGAQYAGTMQRLYFYWCNNTSTGSNPPAAIDDIAISEIICGRPNLVRSLNYTPHGANITFEPASPSDNQWDLVCGRVGFNPDQATPLEITESLYTLTNLLPGTLYEVYVRTNCGDRTSTWSSVHSFRTSCGTIAALPFIENMDTYTTGATSFPVCWTRNSTVNTSYPQISSSYPHSSPNSLYFKLSDSVITNNLIATPEFDASIPVNSLMVSFWMYKNSGAGQFKVGVMSNPLDITTFETIQTFNNSIYPTAYQELSLAGYNGNGHYIAFLFDSTIVNHTPNTSGHSVYLDDVKIRTIPTCSRPSNLTVVDVLQTEATLSWTSHGSETEWELVYDTVAFNPDMGLTGRQIVSVNSNPATLTDLRFNKTYYVCVRAKCSDSDLSEWCLNNISFTTLCSNHQLPFVENFANTTFPPACWQKWSGFVDSTVTSGGSWNRVDNNNGINGAHVKFNIYGINARSWLVSPPVDLSTAVHPKLYFDLALTDYGNGNVIEHSGTQPDDKFMVLVSSDFGATWSQRTVWNNSLENPGDYVYDLIYYKAKTVEVDLQNFVTASNPVMIAFYGESTVMGGDNDLHIGNIRVSEHISCMKPYALQLDSISESELMISWSQGRDETAYDIAYGLPGFNLNDETAYTLLANVTDTFAVLNGLDANVTYEIYVRSNCGSDVSEWTLPERYKTDVILAVIPYICNFEDENETKQWLFANQSNATANNWYIDTAVNSVYDTNGTHALYISNNGGLSNAYTISPSCIVWAYRDIRFGDAMEYAFSFDWKCMGESSYDYLKVFVGNVTPVANTGTTIDVTGLTPLGTYLSGQNSWQTQNYVLDYTYNHSIKRIYFVWINDNSGGTQPPIALDNIKIIPVDCGRPIHVTAPLITDQTATISWDSGHEDLSFEVVYDTVGFNPNNATPVSVTENSLVLTNLQPVTNYSVYVRTVCSDGTSEWSFVYNFTTTCSSFPVPFLEDFTATAFSPNCWNRYSGLASQVFAGTPLSNTTSGWLRATSNYGLTTPHAKINIWGTDIKNWLVTPSIDLTGTVNPTLIFELALTKYNSGDPTNGVGSDDQFMVVVSVDHGATWLAANATVWGSQATADYTFADIASNGERIVIPLTQYAGNIIKIGFYGESTVSNADNDLHIDSVRVEEAEVCNPPSNLTVSAMTISGATIAWTAGGGETSWVVEYKKSTVTDYTSTTVSTPTYTISELEANTVYDIRVKAICSPVSQSNYVTVQFTTGRTYIINATAGAGGTIEPAGEVVVAEGASQLFNITPNSNYGIAEVTVDNGSVGSVGTYTFSNVVAHHTLHAEFIYTSIDDYGFDKSIILMPNPAENFIQLTIDDEELNVKEAGIYDVYGKLIQIVHLKNRTNTIDLSSLSSGVYFIRLVGKTETITKKFIKK